MAHADIAHEEPPPAYEDVVTEARSAPSSDFASGADTGWTKGRVRAMSLDHTLSARDRALQKTRNDRGSGCVDGRSAVDDEKAALAEENARCFSWLSMCMRFRAPRQRSEGQ